MYCELCIHFKFCVGLQQRLLTFPCWRCDAASSVWELRVERASEPAESKKHTKELFCTWPPPPPPSAAALSHSVTRSCHTHTHITLSHTHTCVAGTYGTGLAGVDRLDRGNIVRHCHTTLSHRSLSHTTSSHTTLSHTQTTLSHTHYCVTRNNVTCRLVLSLCSYIHQRCSLVDTWQRVYRVEQC